MELSNRKKNGMFFTILVACIAGSMLSTALTTALPQMMQDFAIDSSTGQWMTSIFSLVMGIATLAAPFLMKRIATKRLYIITMIVFIIGLLLSGMTSSFSVMMVGRILQAIGNGVMTALGQVIILTVYPPERRGSVMGVYGLAIGASPVIAPTLAGIVVDLWGWRMIFLAVLAVVSVSLGMAFFLFEDVLENADEKLDVLSLALCSVGVCGLLLGAGNIGNYSFFSVSVLLPLVMGIVGTAAFAYRQLHMETPFMELRILGVSRYRLAVLASMLLYAVVIASSLLLSLYIQNVRGYSATVSGLTTLPGALATALVSPVSGKIYDKIGIKKLFLSGACMLVVSSLGMCFSSNAMPLVVVGGLNLIRCIGVGCLMMPFVTWGMSGLNVKNTSHGTALITSLRTVAGAFGSAVFVAVVNVVADGAGQAAGMRAAFAGLTIFGAAELVLAIYVVARKDI